MFGIDEVGRGALAGPVVACCAYWINPCTISGIKDSKLLTAEKRSYIFEAIKSKKDQDIVYGIGVVDVETIDDCNILQASLKAMRIALINCPCSNVPSIPIYVDGLHAFEFTRSVIPIVKGDQKVLAIATASIIAKVYRDAIMDELSLECPCYMWHKNKGYGTKDHLLAIEQFGITPHHRKHYKPCKTIYKDSRYM